MNTPLTYRLLALTALGQAVVMEPFSVKSAGYEGYRGLSSASGLGFTITVSS